VSKAWWLAEEMARPLESDDLLYPSTKAASEATFRAAEAVGIQVPTWTPTYAAFQAAEAALCADFDLALECLSALCAIPGPREALAPQ